MDAALRLLTARHDGDDIETTKPVYLCQADLDLPAPGYGLGGPQDDEVVEPGPHAAAGPFSGTALPRPSGDGVVTKDEFSAFAFWPTPPSRFRRASVAAAFNYRTTAI